MVCDHSSAWLDRSVSFRNVMSVSFTVAVFDISCSNLQQLIGFCSMKVLKSCVLVAGEMVDPVLKYTFFFRSLSKRVCTRCMYVIYTVYVCHIHRVYMSNTLCMYVIYTVYVQHIHSLCTSYTPCIQSICTVYARQTHRVLPHKHCVLRHTHRVLCYINRVLRYINRVSRHIHRVLRHIKTCITSYTPCITSYTPYITSYTPCMYVYVRHRQDRVNHSAGKHRPVGLDPYRSAGHRFITLADC